MSKVQPSQRHKQALYELFQRGLSVSEESSQSNFDELSRADFLSEFISRSIQRFVTEALEQEVSDYLGRDYYQRRGQSAGGPKNGTGWDRDSGPAMRDDSNYGVLGFGNALLI